MTGKSIFMFAAFVAGAVLPLQALINARLGAAVGGPSAAAAVSFAIGTIGLLAFIFITNTPAPNTDAISVLPWWAWVGGLLGAYYVATATMTAPVLGAASMVSLVIAGQMIASLLLDHYGVLHAAQPISLQKMVGAFLLIGGVYLITKPVPIETIT